MALVQSANATETITYNTNTLGTEILKDTSAVSLKHIYELLATTTQFSMKLDIKNGEVTLPLGGFIFPMSQFYSYLLSDTVDIQLQSITLSDPKSFDNTIEWLDSKIIINKGKEKIYFSNEDTFHSEIKKFVKYGKVGEKRQLKFKINDTIPVFVYLELIIDQESIRLYNYNILDDTTEAGSYLDLFPIEMRAIDHKLYLEMVYRIAAYSKTGGGKNVSEDDVSKILKEVEVKSNYEAPLFLNSKRFSFLNGLVFKDYKLRLENYTYKLFMHEIERLKLILSPDKEVEKINSLIHLVNTTIQKDFEKMCTSYRYFNWAVNMEHDIMGYHNGSSWVTEKPLETNFEDESSKIILKYPRTTWRQPQIESPIDLEIQCIGTEEGIESNTLLCEGIEKTDSNFIETCFSIEKNLYGSNLYRILKNQDGVFIVSYSKEKVLIGTYIVSVHGEQCRIIYSDQLIKPFSDLQKV